MLFSKYRSESLGGRRHRQPGSDAPGLPHVPSTSRADSSSGPGLFPNSPPYPQPYVPAAAAAPPQRYLGSVPHSLSPTQSRAVPGGGGAGPPPPPPAPPPLPLLSYHPDARGPPGSMVLTFEQGKLLHACHSRLRSCDSLLGLPLSFPHTIPPFFPRP
jgi:hypothetical protein